MAESIITGCFLSRVEAYLSSTQALRAIMTGIGDSASDFMEKCRLGKASNLNISQTFPLFPINLDSAVGLGRRSHKSRMHTDKHGFWATVFAHSPGEPLLFCKGFVSVSIGVHPWLNCGF